MYVLGVVFVAVGLCSGLYSAVVYVALECTALSVLADVICFPISAFVPAHESVVIYVFIRLYDALCAQVFVGWGRGSYLYVYCY